MNPWLTIPLDDYEHHMTLPDIAQAQMLAEQLRQLIAKHRPQSAALLGAAGGNGLSSVDESIVRRVVAVDVNACYLDACIERYAAKFEQFEPIVHDLALGPPAIKPVDLVFAGLVLEYLPSTQWTHVLTSNLTPRGIAAVVLQLPSDAHAEVSASPFTSLQQLESLFRFVAPKELEAGMESLGFAMIETHTVELLSGKRFLVVAWRYSLV